MTAWEMSDRQLSNMAIALDQDMSLPSTSGSMTSPVMSTENISGMETKFDHRERVPYRDSKMAANVVFSVLISTAVSPRLGGQNAMIDEFFQLHTVRLANKLNQNRMGKPILEYCLSDLIFQR
jgi:hypothetical protein